MPTFFVGAVNMPGKRIEGCLSKEAFHELLQQRWSIIGHSSVNNDAYLVHTWKIRLEKNGLQVSLWNIHWILTLQGSLSQAAEFALWYFSVLPADICLNFSSKRKDSQIIYIDSNTTTNDIINGIYPSPRVSPSKRYTDSLQSSYRLQITRTNKRHYNKTLYLIERIEEVAPRNPTLEVSTGVGIRIMAEQVPVYTDVKWIIQFCKDQDLPWFPLL